MVQSSIGCSNLEQIDLGKLETLKPKSTGEMFRCCRNLESIQSKEIHIGNQCDTTDMFAWCINLKDGELEKITY